MPVHLQHLQLSRVRRGEEHEAWAGWKVYDWVDVVPVLD